jgi:hypothetical protein
MHLTPEEQYAADERDGVYNILLDAENHRCRVAEVSERAAWSVFIRIIVAVSVLGVIGYLMGLIK